MKYLFFLLLVLLSILQYSFWFGKYGVYDFFCVKNQLKIQESCDHRYKLKVHNNELLLEINDLIHNRDEAMEERARDELNMIKSDEYFYRLILINKSE